MKIVTQVATDNYGGGKEAAEAMIEALGEAGGKIAVLHFKQAESCLLRVKGFREVIDAHNAGGQGEDRDRRRSWRAAAPRTWATRPPRTRCSRTRICAASSPSTTRRRSARGRRWRKRARPQQVVIVGFDGQPEGKQAIKDGKIYADPIQFPDKMGVQIVDAIIRHSEGRNAAAADAHPDEPLPQGRRGKGPRPEIDSVARQAEVRGRPASDAAFGQPTGGREGVVESLGWPQPATHSLSRYSGRGRE